MSLFRNGLFKRLLLACLCLGIVHSALARCVAEDQPYPNQHLTIAVKFAPPFVFESTTPSPETGNWSGLAIDLWSDIASCLSMTADFIEYTDIDELLEAVANQEVDIAVGAFSLSADREREVDFSHSYYQAHLGVMVVDQSGLATLKTLIERFPLAEFLFVVSGLLLFMVTIAVLYWRSEQPKENPLFSDGPLKGFYNALIWATLLIFSGRGDPFELRTRSGQVLVIFLMFFGVTIVSAVTAVLTSSLTLRSLDQQISSVDDLKSKSVAYLDRVLDENGKQPVRDWLAERRINATVVRSWPETLSALTNHRLDALVHDREIMQYLVKEDYLKGVKVLPLSLKQEPYSFIFPENSELTERVNLQLLSYIGEDYWLQRQAFYLGNY